MNPMDMRTVILSYVVSNAICVALITLLWIQNRRRFAGLGFWLADFAMQLAMIVLIALRGAVPDLVSMVVSNTLLISGTILLYMGLERFVGKRGTQIHNAILLVIFILFHIYFTVMKPNLAARNINISLDLLILCSQAAWLMLQKSDADMRPIARGVGIVFVAFCVVSAARIIIDLAVPPNNDFFHSSIYDTLLVLTYQMLFIILTFSLALMVNRRLIVDLERDIAERQQIEHALGLSEEKFSKAFHSSPDAILITRLSNGQIIEVNEGFCHTTGYSRKEALASSSISLGLWVNPQDREQCIAALQKNHIVHNREYNFHTKSGGTLNGLYSGEIIDLDNEAHILSVVRDITKRKQAEKALRESEEHLKMSQEIAHLGSWDLDLDDNRLTWSDEVYRIFGLEPQEFDATYEAFLEAVHPNDRVEVDKAYSGSINEGSDSYEIEHRIVRKTNGEIRYVHEKCKHLRDKSGKVIRSIGMVHDITERRHAEEIVRLRLRLWEYATIHPVDELMQKALDEIGELTNSPIGFYHFVEEDQNTLSLQAWSTRTLQEFCQAEGKGLHYSINKAGVWVDCVHQRKPIIHNNYASLPHRKGMPEGHAEVIRELVVPTMRNGQVVSILGVGNKPTDYDEHDVELVAYVADVVWEIVGRRRAEEALRQSNSELQARNEELDAFGHTVAHDLKGPLSNIISFAYLLEDRENPLSEEETRLMLQIIKQMGLKMDSIIEELMLLAGLRKAEVKAEPVSMTSIITDIMKRLATVIDESQAEIIYPANWPEAMGHAPWIEEVWINYISNAVKYGGHPPRIELGATEENGLIRFWVHDNGPGLAPEKQVRLFVPFERLDQTHLAGHGLGLSIVQRIVERMGGQVDIESSGVPGEGSTFSFTLPIAQNQLQSKEANIEQKT